MFGKLFISNLKIFRFTVYTFSRCWFLTLRLLPHHLLFKHLHLIRWKLRRLVNNLIFKTFFLNQIVNWNNYIAYSKEFSVLTIKWHGILIPERYSSVLVMILRYAADVFPMLAHYPTSGVISISPIRSRNSNFIVFIIHLTLLIFRVMIIEPLVMHCVLHFRTLYNGRVCFDTAIAWLWGIFGSTLALGIDRGTHRGKMCYMTGIKV
jgi:hypothetical protein